MRHHQLHQPNSFSHRLRKFIFLVAEAASITAVVAVFATTNRVYADNKPIQFTSVPSLQQFLERKTLGSAKDLGSARIPAFDPRRPCYVGEMAGCIIGDDLIGPDNIQNFTDRGSINFENIQKLNNSFNSTQAPFSLDPLPAQLRLFEFPI